MAQKIFGRIVNAINGQIVQMSSQREYFNPWKGNPDAENVFSRETKLTLKIVFWLIVSRIVQSLPVSLSWFFDQLDLPVPGKSAFSMKRRLIKSAFFESVSEWTVSEYYGKSRKVKTWHGLVVLACDGSRIALPDVRELGDAYGYYHSNKGEQLYPCAKATIFQDTLNNMTVLARLVDKDTDERHTFKDCFSKANALAGGNSIIILDRGYFSYLLMYLMTANKQLFVMKSQKAPWRTEFIDSGKKEAVIDIVPSRAASIHTDRRWRREADKNLTVRLVRFDHPDGSADVLVTNIMDPKEESARNIIELYRLRWPAETAYGVYKNDLALELFSSFRIDGILQDFHAAIIMYNLASILAADCNRSDDRRKPDMNVAVGIMHNLCPVLAGVLSVCKIAGRIRGDTEYLGRCLTRIVPHRSFKRVKRRRKINGKFYRHTNFAMAL